MIEFCNAMRQAEIDPPAGIFADGTLHRFHITGDKPGTENGWYVLHNDPPAGAFGRWNKGEGGTSQTWNGQEYQSYTPEEKARYKTNMEVLKRQRQEDQARVYAAAREKAKTVLDKSKPAPAEHSYLAKKGIKPNGARLSNGALVIPLRDTGGTLHGLQFIDAEGSKKFLTGTAKAGHYFAIGKPDGVLCLAEGFATGASIHESTGHAVAVAFDAGNLEPVAKALRAKYPALKIFVCGDNDQSGTGQRAATAAALAVNGLVAIPPTAGEDFNDLANGAGKEFCAHVVNSATAPLPTPSPGKENPPQAKPERRFNLKSGRELRAMNIKIEWIVDGLIPRNSVVLLYGRGGIGKTTLMMMLANAIDKGVAIFNMATVKTPVVIVDYENSLAVLSERAKRTAVENVLFLDSGQDPPSLDKADWTAYQDLLEDYPGAVFVFDTLRSSHSGDENNSEVMTLIMRRMRQLRDAGATVILLHHTPKGNDRQFKGSGAILDLCDQTLALYQTAKPGSEKEAEEDDDDPNKVYRFGTGKKTRYKPHRVFLSFDTEKELFVMAKDPGDEALEYLHGIISQIDAKTCAKQNEVVTAAGTDKGFDFGGDKKIRSLLKKGTGRYWTVNKGIHNSTIYHPIQFGSLAAPIESEKLPNWNDTPAPFGNTEEKQQSDDTPQTGINAGFGSLSAPFCQTEKQGDDGDLPFDF